MQVTNIKQKSASTEELTLLNPPEVKKKQAVSTKETGNAEQPWSQWQKDILLGALDKLENNIHLDNSHPLSKLDSQPIETYDEALLELSWVKSPSFSKDASAAQANLSADDVLYLFVE